MFTRVTYTKKNMLSESLNLIDHLPATKHSLPLPKRSHRQYEQFRKNTMKTCAFSKTSEPKLGPGREKRWKTAEKELLLLKLRFKDVATLHYLSD